MFLQLFNIIIIIIFYFFIIKDSSRLLRTMRWDLSNSPEADLHRRKFQLP